jgi:hypothetical protein
MTLPQNVKDAVKFANAECGKSSDFTFDMSGADWQTIHAHLLSQDAEIERLQLEIDRRFGIAAEMIAARKERDDLQSRLAVDDALLSRCFVQIGELTKGLDPHDPIYVELQRLSLDWTQHGMRIPPHLSENAHG